MRPDDHAVARELAVEAGRRLVQLRDRGGEPGLLRKAGDRLAHEFLTSELAARRPGDIVLSEEGADDPARLAASRVWIVDPLDGTSEFGEPGRTDWAVHVALWEAAVGLTTGGLTTGGLTTGGLTTRRADHGRADHGRAVRRRGRPPGPGQGAIHGRSRRTAGRPRGERPGADRGQPEPRAAARLWHFRSYWC